MRVALFSGSFPSEPIPDPTQSHSDFSLAPTLSAEMHQVHRPLAFELPERTRSAIADGRRERLETRYRYGFVPDDYLQRPQRRVHERGRRSLDDTALVEADEAELPWRIVVGSVLGLLNQLSKDLIMQTRTQPRKEYAFSWLFNLKPKDKLDIIMADLDLYIWSIQAISMLSAASIKEDPIGVVQGSLEDILSSLVALSLAIEDYCNSGCPLTPSDLFALQGHSLVIPALSTLSTHLDNAIYRLILAFYDYLDNFSFPPRYAARLQAYVNMAK